MVFLCVFCGVFVCVSVCMAEITSKVRFSIILYGNNLQCVPTCDAQPSTKGSSVFVCVCFCIVCNDFVCLCCVARGKTPIDWVCASDW